MLEKIESLELEHWKTSLDSKTIMWIELCHKGKSTNTLSSSVMKELDILVSFIEKEVLNTNKKICAGIIFFSNQPSGFCAGADVKEFTDVAKKSEWAQASLEIVTKGWLLYERIEKISRRLPTVAKVKGFCFGGGFEFALACKFIVAVDHDSTSFSLPEVKLGIYPGWGGIKRLPQRIGIFQGMSLMLSGKFLNARKAFKAGVADVLVPERTADLACERLIKQNPKKKDLSFFNQVLAGPLKRLVCIFIKNNIKKRVKERHYPAPFGILDLWKYHNGNPTVETQIHNRIVGSPTAKNLLRVYQLQESLKGLAKKYTKGSDGQVPPILNHIHVIGAGTMGGDIAIWCVLKGLKVTLQDVSTSQIAKILKKAPLEVKRKFGNKYKQMKLCDMLIPDPSGHGIKKADVIIEAATENLKIKQEIFAKIEKDALPTALLCSNTSSIKIEEIAKGLKDTSRLVGVHFFNPVLRMPLVEIIKSKNCDQNFFDLAINFTGKIKKLPLPVKSSPGFLVNAVLMPYLLSAMRTVDNGISPEDIDSAMTNWGMPMGPIELVDTVGLDVCLAVGNTMTNDDPTPICLKDLNQKDHLGKKSNRGFYKWEKGKKVKERKLKLNDDEQRNLAENLIQPLINRTSELVTEGIVESEEMADAGVIFGTGFAPFLGGPINFSKNNKIESL